jgi:toxin-antitoxin system PIN domain toxin
VLIVDTNVLVDAADEFSQFHRPCRAWINRQRPRPDAWYATWPICYEFLRVTTHRRVLHRPWSISAAWEFVTELLDSPGFGILVQTQRHADVAKEVFSELPDLAGNILHDAHTAILMREHGIKQICTRDTDFHRFRFLEVIDPLRA